MSFFSSPHLSHFLWAGVHWASRHAAVFIWVRNHLSCIWHLDKVDGQGGEMRADDGERQLTVSGDSALLSSFFPPPLIPSLYCILIGWLMYHGNSLWMQEAGEVKGKVAAAAEVWCRSSLFFIPSCCWQSVWGKWKHYSTCTALSTHPGICCAPTLSYCFLLRLHQHPFYSNNPHLQLHTSTPLPLLLLPHISSSFSAAPLL